MFSLKIKNFYSIQLGLLRSTLFTLIHFSPIGAIWSNLFILGTFCPLWFYSIHYVHFGPIQSTLLLFAPLLSNFVLFSPLRSSLFYSVWFGPMQSTLSISVLFGPFCPLRSYSVHSFLFGQFSPFGPILSIWSTLFDLVQFGPFRSLRFILVHFDLCLCTYIMRTDMFGLKAPNLYPNLLLKKKTQTLNI